MSLHPLTNFEIQKYYQNELKLNDVYSRNNLPKKLKNGADEGTHWFALFCNQIEIGYFDGFVVEHVPEDIKRIFWD